MGATPLTLAIDYHLGAPIIAEPVWFRHSFENGGRLSTYDQVFGWTQLLWLLLAAYLVLARSVNFTRAPTSCALILLGVWLLIVTEATDGIDNFSVLALSCTVFPLAAIALVIVDSDLSPHVARWLFVSFALVSAIIFFLRNGFPVFSAVGNTRSGVFLFGSAPDSAFSLALLASGSLAMAFAGSRFAAFAAAASIGAVAMTGTRGAAAAIGVAMMIVVWSTRRNLSHAPRALVAALAVAFALIIALLYSRRPLGGAADITTRFRVEYLSYAWSRYLQQPIWGWGVSAAGALGFRAAHNTLLGIANAGGPPALLAWLAAWFIPFRRALAHSHADRAIAYAVVAAALVVWVTSGPEVLLYSPPTNLLPLFLAFGAARGR